MNRQFGPFTALEFYTCALTAAILVPATGILIVDVLTVEMTGAALLFMVFWAKYFKPRS